MIKRHMFIIALMAGLIAGYNYLDITCPILAITGHPCPACGSTHAILALIHRDWQAYLEYQPMALPLALATLMCFHIRVMRTPFREISEIFICNILLLNMALYISRF